MLPLRTREEIAELIRTAAVGSESTVRVGLTGCTSAKWSAYVTRHESSSHPIEFAAIQRESLLTMDKYDLAEQAPLTEAIDIGPNPVVPTSILRTMADARKYVAELKNHAQDSNRMTAIERVEAASEHPTEALIKAATDFLRLSHKYRPLVW